MTFGSQSRLRKEALAKMEEIVEDSGIASLVVLTTLKTLEKKGLIYWKDRY